VTGLLITIPCFRRWPLAVGFARQLSMKMALDHREPRLWVHESTVQSDGLEDA